MAWYKIHYVHDECGTSWHGEWSCACNDRCPACNKEIEPVEYTDVSTGIEFDQTAGEWLVLRSSPDAEDQPKYSETRFEEKRQALRFIARGRMCVASAAGRLSI